MRRIITYCVIICFMLSQNGFVQWLKLPILFQHYQEHKILDAGTTLTSYLIQHYIEDEQHADQSRDNQLPFKSCTNIATTVVIATCPKPFEFSLQPWYPLVYKKQLSRYHPTYSASYTAAIFQPPKLFV